MTRKNFVAIRQSLMEAGKKAMVIFQPSGRRGEVGLGVTIIEASRQLGAEIETLCGGKRVCGKCKVRIEEGFFEKYGVHSSRSHVSAWEQEETGFINETERQGGYRLGCVAKLLGDVLVFVPEESRADQYVVSKPARDIHIQWNPAVKYHYLEVLEPTFEQPTGDFERITDELYRQYGLRNLRVDYFALRKLPARLRGQNGRKITVAVWMDHEVIGVLPGKVEDSYGLAVDLGTTSIAAYLCNLRTMEVVDTVSMMNPQCKYGEDVMSRITYHMMHEDGLERMSRDIIAALNSLVKRACDGTHPPKEKEKRTVAVEDIEEAGEEAGGVEEDKQKKYLRLKPDDLIDMTIVGNTVMHHLLLKLDPQYLGLIPFPPVVHRSLDIKARDRGIKINESAYVHILPNVAGFVGADTVGVLIAEEPHKSNEVQLIIDIGTNGELVLGNKEKLIASSCATGPALEGAHLSFGMRAAPGAIERLRIDPETHEVDYKVVGRDAWKSYSKAEEMKTKGICGSGILEALAELYCAGVILKSGKFNPNQKSKRYRINPETDQPEFVIAWKEETTLGKDVVISQKDIRQIQLAKGALYCGCKLMMRHMGIDKVDKVKIAGAFGSRVDPQKALIIGLFPDCALEKIIPVGNAAGDGARAALLNREKRVEADWVAANVEYIELTVEPDFQQNFMESLQIPHMEDAFPHLEGIVPPEILRQP